jgi:hypothetical protein
VLGMEPRASLMLSRGSTSELHPQSCPDCFDLISKIVMYCILHFLLYFPSLQLFAGLLDTFSYTSGNVR